MFDENNTLWCKMKKKNKFRKIVWEALVIMKGENLAVNLYVVKGETLQDEESYFK